MRLDIENITFKGDYNTKIIGTGDSNIIISDKGNDFINGKGGDDNINSGDGDDIIVRGEQGIATIDGGRGNDTYNKFTCRNIFHRLW